MFWEVFRKLCADIGKSPNAVAKELKIPSGSVTAWKNGATPRPATLKKISEYFGVTVDFLTYALETDKKEKPIFFSEDELDDAKKILIEKIRLMDKDTIDALNTVADMILAKRGK